MNPPDNSAEPPKEGIAATDEILQVMYWLRGEGDRARSNPDRPGALGGDGPGLHLQSYMDVLVVRGKASDLTVLG